MSYYNDKGYLEQVRRGDLVLWQVTKQDAAQRPRIVALNNGLLAQQRTFNDNTGRLANASVTTAANVARVQESYEYDELGNVRKRVQYWDAGGFQETFTYDSLNRIDTSTVAGQAQQVFTYDLAGNIKTKTGLGTYNYAGQGATAVQPHAVQSITGLGGSFTYDENGNLRSGAGRVACWTSFDMPARISKGGSVLDCTGGSASSGFVYGPEHQRTRQDRSDGVTTDYAGAQEVEMSAAGATVKTY